eukprot:m.217367 g.217367  ORF g.217367 m.217367 type:complete len:92 (-) comp15885_c0_seq10:1688-1963(-)
MVEAEENAMEDMSEELRALEMQMDEEYGDEEEEQTEFYCEACKKLFKKEKQWKNHERSKKHLAAVAKLRTELEVFVSIVSLILRSRPRPSC